MSLLENNGMSPNEVLNVLKTLVPIIEVEVPRVQVFWDDDNKIQQPLSYNVVLETQLGYEVYVQIKFRLDPEASYQNKSIYERVLRIIES